MTKRLFLFHGNTLLRAGKRFKSTVKQSPSEYCLEIVRKNDYENFLCTLLLPQEHRAAGFAIRAFNVEIALVEDQVNDPKIGEMRLKFWMNSLNNIYEGKPPKSPVTLELHRILQTHSFSKRYLKRLIDARLEKISGAGFPSLEAMEKYSEYSFSSIYYLLLEAHKVVDIHADHVASHLGKSHGIVTLIRSVPHNARRRTNVLPQDIMTKHGVSTEAVLQGETSTSLQDVVCEIASRGKQHLDTALSLKSKIKEKLPGPVFLPSICVASYLEQLKKADFNVFDKRLQRKQALLPLRLLWAKFLER